MKDGGIKNIIISSLEKENDYGQVTLELLEMVDYDFEKGFAESVLAKIIERGKLIRHEFDNQLRLAFKSVSIAAAAAAILIMVSIFLNEGNLSVDSLLGVGDDYSESIVYLLTGE